ncbi:MAG: hypothetical protein ACKPKO_32090, partial [Candidatus Fonsibacter sp.]
SDPWWEGAITVNQQQSQEWPCIIDTGDIGSGTFAVCNERVCTLLACIEFITGELLNGVKELACGMEGKALLRESNKSLKEFSMWVQEVASKGAGQLFRWMMDDARGEVLQFDFKEGATVGPAKFMEGVHNEWAAL